MTFGSLFAGIGGLDLGFEWAGLECRWQVEINPFCQAVLAKHWPDVPRFSDVRTVGAGNLEPVDVIVGGFPCQDISDAGKREGIDGQRSGLWREYARVICELRPRFVVVENVRGLLVRGIDRVLGDLADLGYDAEWTSLRASDVGAPHRRERIFIVAYARREGIERGRGTGDVGSEASGRASAAPERQRLWYTTGASGEAVADASRDGLRRGGQPEPGGQQGARGPEPDGRGDGGGRRRDDGRRRERRTARAAAHGTRAGRWTR